MSNIITFGTFDMFHIGHTNILNRAREYGDNLYVGVSSDCFTITKKGVAPVDSLETRLKNVRNNPSVTDVFVEESLELKQDYIDRYHADILVMGDDWKGKFDDLNCRVIYLPRTENISSTLLRQQLEYSGSKA